MIPRFRLNANCSYSYHFQERGLPHNLIVLFFKAKFNQRSLLAMLFKMIRSLPLLLVVAVMVGVFSAYAQDAAVTMQSTQFNVVEEAEKVQTILEGFEGEAVFVGSEEGPLLDLLRAEAEAGSGATDVVGSIHGTFPVLAQDDLLFDMSELTAAIDAEHDIVDAYVELGKLGTTDYQYYVPWMQATYVMAANELALEHLPEGADVNALTWEQLAEWGANMQEATGENKLGFPVAGLFHRFLEGYIYPSYTGAMVTQFRSLEAVAMFEFLRDDLWPYVNAESINYSFMNEPLLSGEVWVAFDHTARLKPAFDAMANGDTEEVFVAFPAPAGPAGLGFMPVIAGLAVPYTAPNPDGAEALIEFMLSPETQSAVLNELGFFPVIADVDMTNLSEGVAALSDAVAATTTAENAVVALLPIGLGERGGEINEVYRNAFNRIVIDGEDIATVLDEEGETLNTLMSETGAPCWSPDPVSEGACEVVAAQ
jgi:multiple sugar transport system substrate-binding protein